MLFYNKVKIVLFFILATMFFSDAYGCKVLNVTWNSSEDLDNHYRIRILKFISGDVTACPDTSYKYSKNNYIQLESDENFSYSFQVQSVNTYGLFSEYSENITVNPVYSDVKNNQINVPQKFELYQNQPNPFNPSTTINYYISETSTVNISVYNISGQKISVIQNGVEDSGYHSIVWNASGMPTGTYFCTLKTEKFCKTNKMLLLK